MNNTGSGGKNPKKKVGKNGNSREKQNESKWQTKHIHRKKTEKGK